MYIMVAEDILKHASRVAVNILRPTTEDIGDGL